MLDKTELQPTEEQAEIVATVRDSGDNLCINAFAGTGKSSTLEMAQAVVPTSKLPILYLAFNRSVVKDMKERVPDTTVVKTLNSCGNGVWYKTVGKCTVDLKKSQLLYKQMELSGADKREASESYWTIQSAIGLAKSFGYIPDGKYSHAKRLISRSDFYDSLEEKTSPFIQSLIDSLLHESIKTAYKGFIDFDDQVYMPTLFGGSFPRFPLVMVDEAQDLNAVNHEMLGKLVTNRFCMVGDPCQCHPPGTRIKVTGQGEVPIEEVVKHQEVAAYSTRASRFAGIDTQGREIEEIVKFHFNGNLVVVNVADKAVKMTPNHRCVTRIDREAKGHILYLMRKGDRFRLGTTRIKNGNGNAFGPSMRARQERADAVWLLHVYPTPVEAHIAEQVYSYKYGIPTLLFTNPLDQDKLDIIWDQIGPNIENGLSILSFFGRTIDFPIWAKGDSNFIGFHRACPVHAVNIVTGLMTMLTFPKGNWTPVTVSRESYIGDVYGITVNPTEGGNRVYFANEVLVHNSIYRFRGAVQSGMQRLAQRFKTVDKTLSISFRCPQAVVEAARWRVPDFKWIKSGGHYEVLESLRAMDIPDGATIICRNNAPLFRCAFRLLAARRSVTVAGSEIGPKVTAILRKLGEDRTTKADTFLLISNWRDAALEKSNSPSKVNDIADCLEVFAEFGETLGQAVAYAEYLFKSQGSIKLITGHKAKGQEWDTVYHLDPWLCQDTEQDNNLRYVIQTRSADQAFEINSSDIRWS